MNKKWNIDKVKKFVFDNSDCKLISENYTQIKDSLLFECKCGRVFFTSFDRFINGKRRCNMCLERKKYTYEDVRDYTKNNSDCELLSTDFSGYFKNLVFKCKCGEKFETTFQNFKTGKKRQCNICGYNITANKNTISQNELSTLISELDVALLSDYKNAKDKITLKDNDGYFYSISYTNLKTNKVLNPFNAKNEFTYNNILLWLEKNNKEFILVSDQYCKMRNKLKWQCKTCLNVWETSFEHILNGTGCPFCIKSKGEKRIEDILNKYYIYHNSQKEFDNLLGIKNGNLSYDFFLPEYNLLIEYQGQQHEMFIKGFHKSIKDFEKQQEHDKRKREYAKQNNIELLEIWYWDFKNIEAILDNELIKYSSLNRGG